MALNASPTSSAVQEVAALACVECRKRHLRCDGRRPKCTRCTASRADCSYLPSRRGIRSDRHKSRTPRRSSMIAEQRPSLSSSTSAGSLQVNQAQGFRNSLLSPSPSDTSSIRNGSHCSSSMHPPTGSSVNPTRHGRPTADSADSLLSQTDSGHQGINEHYIDHFYTDFHREHPILTPRSDQAWYQYPLCLKLVMQLIGSHYCSSITCASLYQNTQACLSGTIGNTHYEVQAWLLFAIILQARAEHTMALHALTKAVNLALGLGMNRPEYAIQYGQGQLSRDNSLRETWWELVIVDVLMAAFSRKNRLIRDEIDLNMPLPYDDVALRTPGPRRPQLRTLQVFQNRMFLADCVDFPSSAYRIEAACALRRVLEISLDPDADPDAVQSMDNWLAAWTYHLPKDKAQVVSAYGAVDNMLFQANIIIHSAVVLLHLPRSNLVSQTPFSTGGLACAQTSSSKVSTSSAHIHAIKALSASKALSDLAALRTPSQKDSPTVVCGLALAAMIQLAGGRFHGGQCLEQHRNRISLILGVLKNLGRYFELATRAEQQIRPLAASLFIPNGFQTQPQPESNPEVEHAFDFSALFFDDLWPHDILRSMGSPLVLDSSGLAYCHT